MAIKQSEKWDSIEKYVLYLKHLAAYLLFAKEFVNKRRVLEIGCGTGYGCNELSECASFIASVDVSKENILYCSNNYAKDNLAFLLGDGTSLPFKAETFDTVMSFQVIEHIPKRSVLNYLRETKRVLRPGGVFVLATPNARLRLLPFQKPWNREHEQEYTGKQLKMLLTEVFQESKVYGLYASEELLSIEKNRVKQSPPNVYLVGPIYRLLKWFLPSSLFSRLKRMGAILLRTHRETPCLASPEEYARRFSLSDFRIDPNCPQDSMDLFGICKRTM